MTADKLEELKRLRKAGTQGEWSTRDLMIGPGGSGVAVIVAACPQDEVDANTGLIIAAVNALPSLIAEIERLRAIVLASDAIPCGAHAMINAKTVTKQWVLDNPQVAADAIERLTRERDVAEKMVLQLREALKAHHEWHLNAGTLGLPTGEGEWIEIDNGAEYSDSRLFDITTAALDASANPLVIPEEGWEPMPRGGMRQHFWATSVLERRNRRAAEALVKVLEERLNWIANEASMSMFQSQTEMLIGIRGVARAALEKKP